MISFIIPTLMEEKYIGKTLEYLSKYTGPHEIIVSDANSTDRTVEIAQAFAHKIIVHSVEGTRLSISAGRNLGAEIAQGEYLVFLDADICIIEPNSFFKKALALFEHDPHLVGVTIELRVFKELLTWGDKLVIPFFIYARAFMNNFLGIGAATGEFQMVRKSVYDQVGGYTGKLTVGEDDDFFRKIRKIGKTRLVLGLTAYHSGRRAHALGWPKLLLIWTIDTLSIIFFKRPRSKEWKPIR